jgi:hypothetical protein
MKRLPSIALWLLLLSNVAMGQAYQGGPGSGVFQSGVGPSSGLLTVLGNQNPTSATTQDNGLAKLDLLTEVNADRKWQQTFAGLYQNNLLYGAFTFSKELTFSSFTQSNMLNAYLYDTNFSLASGATHTVTFSGGAPGVINWATNGLVNGTPINFTTTGVLPTNITASTTYYVVNTATNTFQVAATPGGAIIDTSTGSPSGTNTANVNARESVAFMPVADIRNNATGQTWTMNPICIIGTMTTSRCTGIEVDMLNIGTNGTSSNSQAYSAVAQGSGAIYGQAYSVQTDGSGKFSNGYYVNVGAIVGGGYAWTLSNGDFKVDTSGNTTVANLAATGTITSTVSSGVALSISGSSAIRQTTASATLFIDSSGGDGGSGSIDLRTGGGFTSALVAWADQGVSIGTVTDPGTNNLLVAGSVSATLANTGTTSAVCYDTSTKLFSYDGTIGTCTLSDGRFKNVEGPLTGALAKLLQIKGVYYDWKDPATYGTGRQVGIIAQDVQKVYPELVSTDATGKLSADYQKLVAPIIEAMRELKADNDDLRACNDNWKCRLFGIR